MHDPSSINQELLEENALLKQRIQELELSDSDRRQAEEEKRLLEERLQHADKLESIGTLAGGIAHDFNNLLMGIQGYASLMLLDLDPSDPHYERLKRIEEQVQSGADLTRQLLGFARG
jgi:two-component system cell cycle sensor histidine kinase/response regulator CckA